MQIEEPVLVTMVTKAVVGHRLERHPNGRGAHTAGPSATPGPAGAGRRGRGSQHPDGDAGLAEMAQRILDHVDRCGSPTRQ